MQGTQVLDVALGLFFMYLLLSLVCSAAAEILAGFGRLRARNLERAITNALADESRPDMASRFYAHPLIRALYRGEHKPSYIAGTVFADVLLDLMVPGDKKSGSSGTDLANTLRAQPADSPLRNVLLLYLDKSENDPSRLREQLTAWYDHIMARATGWYRRTTQAILFVTALILSCLGNLDTTHVAKTLANGLVAKELLLAEIQAPTAQANNAGLADQKADYLRQYSLPLGWSSYEKINWFDKVLGLLLTVIAASLGAPFWFDLIRRISHIRITGKP